MKAELTMQGPPELHSCSTFLRAGSCIKVYITSKDHSMRMSAIFAYSFLIIKAAVHLQAPYPDATQRRIRSRRPHATYTSYVAKMVAEE